MIIYNVDEENKTVVARFEGGKEYWAHSLVAMCNNVLASSYLYFPREIVHNVLDSYSDFVGKAKLHPLDVWDVEKGKAVAKKKLLHKWYRVKDRVLEDLQDYMDAEYREACERIEKKLDASWM